ncbi:Carbonic anhydrase 1 [Lamellibrachia satsuma]|nr:Carbonic anhydrase 1 [Lamellibrachia satsuma]
MAVTLVGPSGPKLVNYNVDRYFSGYLRNDPSSIFHGKYHDGILDGVIYTTEESYYLEPMQKYFKKTNRRSRSMLVAYRERDVIWLALNATATRIQADGSNISDRKPRVGEAVYMSDIHAQKYAHVPHQRRRRSWQLDKLYRVCELSVVVDHSFYRAPCGGSLAKTIDKISFAIRAADAYFRRVDFNFDTVADNIGFTIKDVLIYTKKNAPGYRLSESLDPNVVLDSFAHYNLSGSCLGVLFTHREFYKGVIGLAYTGSSTTLGAPGGLCYPRMQHSSGWKWLNSLLLTSRNYLLRIPWSTVALTLTHELGHSFGARHDTSAECLPGGRYGMYLMHSSATDFTKPNSYTFSPCSIRQMGPVVQNKGFCLKTYGTDESCGNYLHDEGEECDCGADQRQCNVFDRCCVPPSTNEPGCRIRHEAGHVCSPLSSPCCTGLCRVETEARVCLAATDCTRAAVCDAVSVECPEPVPLADGTLCAGGVRVCSGGQCVGSRCKLYGWVDCECAGVQDELCQLCCAARNTSGSDCKPAYRLSDTDTLVAPIYKNEADTCNQQSGFCTKTHACITVYPKDVDNVYDAIFQKSAKERMHDMLANYWFYGLLLLVLLFMCFALIRFVYYRDETASTIAYRSAKFTSLWLVMRSQTLTLAEQLRRTELIYDDLISNLKYEKPFGVLLNLFVIGQGQGYEWSYKGKTGPSSWTAHFPECGKKAQSPVDLITSDVVKKHIELKDSFLVSSYNILQGKCIMKNDGLHGHVKMAGGEWKVRGGVLTQNSYILEGFHFHWGENKKTGSEHFVDGRQFPLEMHLIHRLERKSATPKDAKDLAIFGVLFEESEIDNLAFKSVIDGLGRTKFKDEETQLDEFRLRHMLPYDMNTYYTYNGSLTTPPCTESVTWIVFKNPIKMSRDQLSAFRIRKALPENDSAAHSSSMSNNYRPLQPIGVRQIVSVSIAKMESNDPKEAGAAFTGSVVLVVVHPVVDSLNELRFTRQSRLESVLEVENDVMLVQVFPHVA